MAYLTLFRMGGGFHPLGVLAPNLKIVPRRGPCFVTFSLHLFDTVCANLVTWSYIHHEISGFSYIFPYKSLKNGNASKICLVNANNLIFTP